MKYLKRYVNLISKTLRTSVSTEHSYRPALKSFIESNFDGINALNEPKRKKVGAPDFVLLDKINPIGYIETKVVGTSLDEIERSEQLHRYLNGFDSFILTNYTEFRWYVEGELRISVNLGYISRNTTIRVTREKKDKLLNLFNAFINHQAKTINSAQELAVRMAALSKISYKAILATLKDTTKKSNLHSQYSFIKDALLHDLTKPEFADMLAQTIAYGLFTGRVNQDEDDNFNRMTAAYVIPKTNPFLRDLFGQIVGPSIDENLIWIIEDIVKVLKNTNIKMIVKEFEKNYGKEDPILHFYETYLEHYNPEEKINRGVYYTPEPVVKYIVKSVDSLLKSKFAVKGGLSDDGKTTGGFHKVQILDPATGTGTFLSEVIDFIYDSFSDNKGLWSGYVEDHLLPRLNGFELLMAPYTIAHMKLGMKLAKTGYSFESDRRLRLFLTNALKKPGDYQDYAVYSLMSNHLSAEAEGADEIKRDNPIMIILGNPPYMSESVNNLEWINSLLRGVDLINGSDTECYFTIDGNPLGERNTKWLNDDYVKFIRFSQWKIDRTGYGILAFITPHGFLDNPTFRGMRKSLMNTFDDIYIIDAHGNANKHESTNREDQNIFDGIATGTAISIFIKVPNKRKTVRVYHHDLWGNRRNKYEWLEKNDIDTIEWNKINPSNPFYFFIPQDLAYIDEYEMGYKITKAMPLHSNGIVTARDDLTIKYTREEIHDLIKDFPALDPEVAREKYNLRPDTLEWKVKWAQKDLQLTNSSEKYIRPIYYRPFDWRYTYYTGETKGFLNRPRREVMDNFIDKENLAILTSRMTKGEDFKHLLVTDKISEAIALSSKSSNNAFSFPLYFYEDDQKKPNFSDDFVKKVEEKTNLYFSTTRSDQTFNEVDLFYYIVAILSSTNYRERYKEFLKRDYAKIPITSNQTLFLKLVKKGQQLSNVHLFTAQVDIKTSYPIEGDNFVKRLRNAYNKDEQRLYINKNQYFEGVAKDVWEYEIGGYQVIRKWLSYRVDTKLKYEDLIHIQKMVAIIEKLINTQRRVDETIEEHGGFPII